MPAEIWDRPMPSPIIKTMFFGWAAKVTVWGGGGVCTTSFGLQLQVMIVIRKLKKRNLFAGMVESMISKKPQNYKSYLELLISWLFNSGFIGFFTNFCCFFSKTCLAFGKLAFLSFRFIVIGRYYLVQIFGSLASGDYLSVAQ